MNISSLLRSIPGFRPSPPKITGIGVDLGTVNTVVVVNAEKGEDCFPVQIPSVVSVDLKAHKVVEAGDEAKVRIGRSNVDANIIPIRPIQGGIIGDPTMTAALFRQALREMRLSQKQFDTVILGVPLKTTSTHTRELMRVAFEEASAKKVYVISQGMLAAMGTGTIDVRKSQGNLIIDIGGSTTQITLVSLSDVPHGSCIKFGGDDIDAFFVRYANDRNIILGPTRAEEIKIKVSNLNGAGKPDTNFVFRGREKGGCPAELNVSLAEIENYILKQAHERIVKEVQLVLANIPDGLAELSGDLTSTMVILTGGGAMLRGLKEAIDELGLKVIIANDPIMAVPRGIYAALRDPALLEAVKEESLTRNEFNEKHQIKDKRREED
jgi:rod shape-determining protein MreB